MIIFLHSGAYVIYIVLNDHELQLVGEGVRDTISTTISVVQFGDESLDHSWICFLFQVGTYPAHVLYVDKAGMTDTVDK